MRGAPLVTLALILPLQAHPHVGACAALDLGSPPPPPGLIDDGGGTFKVTSSLHVVLDASSSMRAGGVAMLADICTFAAAGAWTITATAVHQSATGEIVVAPVAEPCGAAPDSPPAKRHFTDLRGLLAQADAWAEAKPGTTVLLITDGWNDPAPAVKPVADGPAAVPVVPDRIAVFAPNDDAADQCGSRLRAEDPSCPDIKLRPRRELKGFLATLPSSAPAGSDREGGVNQHNPEPSAPPSTPARRRRAPSTAAVDPRAVVAVLGGNGLCTGTLVAPDAVLTAAHCGAATEVELAPDARGRGLRAPVRERVVHPDGLDVALLRLGTPLHDAEVIVSVRSAADRAPSGELRAFGFGARSAGSLAGAWTLQGVDLVLDGWGCDGRRPAVTGCKPGFEMIVPPQGGADTCRGDSGGPLLELAPFPDPDAGLRCGWRLVGVTSRSISGAGCGQGGIYVRADATLAWMRSHLDDWRKSW